MDLGLKGKRALVCASSKGLGLAAAESLAREGASLMLCARDEAALFAAARSIEQRFGVKVEARVVDLANPDDVERFAAEAIKVMGGIDVLVNNVGGPAPSAAADTELSAWRKGFDQIFLSTAVMSKQIASDMRTRGFGRIITITSLSVVEPIDHLVVSTAMRSAVTGFSKTLANELASHGITVNTVMPGVIHTARIEDLRRAKAERDGTGLSEEMAKTAKLIPAGRLGRPEELGDLVAFLASERASFITGCNIPVDGGLRKGN